MDELKNFSSNARLNKLLTSVVGEVREFANEQIERIQRLTQIGIALSAEQDIDKLLEIIIEEAMSFTSADAGTLYIVDNENHCLQFKILKNLTQNTHLGGTSGREINLPAVPLSVDNQPNHSNVSSYTALTGEIVNIPDVYQAEGFDFTGPKKYDEQTGYRSCSMLVIPMKNHENDIIGVLQLLNATTGDGEVIAFSDEDVDLTASLASQAAVALENATLINDLKDLFEAFIQSIATAIDEKSPYTAGHIRRVTGLTMMIAETINHTNQPPFDNVSLSSDELEELRIAAWMHDIGKITTPEYVIDKSTKLQTIFDRGELIDTRFQLIRQSLENEWLHQQLAAQRNGNTSGDDLEKARQQYEAALTQLDEDLDFIHRCNIAGEKMDDDALARIQRIAAEKFRINGEERSYLTTDEVYNLSVRRGTLTSEERSVIQNHALVSYKMLKQLPFPKKLSKVPEYAGGHHEKLDGTGYPFGLSSEQLPLQARIMAIADIFEALTAKDRPYKRPMKLSTAIRILGNMCDEKHTDRSIYDLLISTGVLLKYADQELNKEQIDVSPDDV